MSDARSANAMHRRPLSTISSLNRKIVPSIFVAPGKGNENSSLRANVKSAVSKTPREIVDSAPVTSTLAPNILNIQLLPPSANISSRAQENKYGRSIFIPNCPDSKRQRSPSITSLDSVISNASMITQGMRSPSPITVPTEMAEGKRHGKENRNNQSASLKKC